MIGLHHLETVVEEDGRLCETGAHRTAVEEHEIEGGAVTGGSRGQTVTSLTGVACLDAETALVRGEQDIGVATVHVTTVDQRHTLLYRADHLCKGTVAHGITGQTDQIIRSTEIIWRRHAVRIDEVGVGHAEIGGLLVHHVTEGQCVASDMLRDGIGGIVVALEHHLVEQIAQEIALTQTDSGVLADEHVVGDPYRISHITILEGQQTGHHLRERGHETGFIGIALTDDIARGVVDEHPGIGTEATELLPPFHRVGIEYRAERKAVDGVDLLESQLLWGEGDTSACPIDHIAGDGDSEEQEQESQAENADMSMRIFHVVLKCDDGDTLPFVCKNR